MYLDLQYFHRRSSKFPAEHLSLLLEWFTPFYRHNSSWYSILGQQLSFKCKHRGVVTIHGPWSRILKTSRLNLKCEVSWTEKRFKIAIICFWVVDNILEWMDLWKQMSSSKCSFRCIWGSFWPLNPATTTVYARSAFYPSLHFTLSLQSAFYTQSAFYPWSTVCSLQSAVCVLHWPLKNLGE